MRFIYPTATNVSTILDSRAVSTIIHVQSNGEHKSIMQQSARAERLRNGRHFTQYSWRLRHQGTSNDKIHAQRCSIPQGPADPFAMSNEKQVVLARNQMQIVRVHHTLYLRLCRSTKIFEHTKQVPAHEVEMEARAIIGWKSLNSKTVSLLSTMCGSGLFTFDNCTHHVYAHERIVFALFTQLLLFKAQQHSWNSHTLKTITFSLCVHVDDFVKVMPHRWKPQLICMKRTLG